MNLRLLVIGAALLLGSPRPGAAAPTRPTAPRSTAMHVELALASKQVHSAAELRLQVHLQNRGPRPARLNTLLLDLPSIVFQVRDRRGQPVPLGPPPLPPEDDGTAGRKALAPGEGLTLRFAGGQLFGSLPPPGDYEVRYHLKLAGAADEWSGELASEWLRFTISG